jgi:cyclopropane fatty-acyl-phospholipid synthase-like methyltransferase
MPDLPFSAWSEENSQTFVDYGRYFVPNREQQIATIAALIPPDEGSFRVLELCCGEGLLAEAILRRFPTCTLFGYDGSAEMRRRAEERLAAYGERFQPVHFDLADQAWRSLDMSVQAVVSSLAIHHLDGPGKGGLFRDVYAMLAPGGAFIVADVIAPTPGMKPCASVPSNSTAMNTLWPSSSVSVGTCTATLIQKTSTILRPSSTSFNGWPRPALWISMSSG